MDNERLTPPSPTRDQVTALAHLAHVHFQSYGDERSNVIAQTCNWILGDSPRPCLAPPQPTQP
jgi:hypothetical protein